jgi:hypothetical protein
MPLAGPGKFDDALGDDSVRKIVCKPEGRAGHFKCDALVAAPPPIARNSVATPARSSFFISNLLVAMADKAAR